MAKILVVDDAAFMRVRAAKVLQDNGHEVAQAENGREAVSKYAEWRPDAVLMDITMTEMDGLAALKEIRKLDPDARVAMVTAMGQQAIVMEALKAGARDFVLKPFQPDRVQRAAEASGGLRGITFMRVEFINPFVQAVTEVLESELGSVPERGSIGLQRSAYTSNEVTAVVAVAGEVAGMVMFAMTQKTATGMVSKMLGQDFPEIHALAQSGIAEIGNVITGRAAVLLSEAGYPSDLAPPMLLIGKNTMISTLDVQRLVIPMVTAFGSIEVQVALKLSGA